MLALHARRLCMGGIVTTTNGSRHIIVGVDGSPQSQGALRWAAREAQRSGGDITAVSVFGSGLAWIDVGSDMEPLIVARSPERAKEALHDAIAATELPPEAEVHVHPVAVRGDPANTLVELAETADLLVVGTRGRGGFTGLLLGSVSQRCAERSPCPVVVVPPPADEREGARA